MNDFSLGGGIAVGGVCVAERYAKTGSFCERFMIGGFDILLYAPQ